MKGFRKLSSIALLLCAFVYPPSLAEAKDISLSNARNEQSAAPEANLIGDKTGELLIAQRRPGRYREIRRRQIIRRRQPYGRYPVIRRRPPFRRYENIRRREQFRERRIIQRRGPYEQYQIRRRY
ncbi:hypothetical protein GNF10_25580 [Nostoc sp. UCD121]|uniref:hypothetical protein n=1 Tax=unclassified Nostoc TaxID=2593658 RepID=UPI001623D1D7|nr:MULTISPECIES: hypothetical protein [unclassified Nostoc]MBC1223566.1 hypothetical protein [Nostoc sp. UCD120]MBC1279238.1 hypothetical protein [Nostoc sp. UCD121]MBC1296115.1 hypothetical protein [Nostoc sp. UCD122]